MGDPTSSSEGSSEQAEPEKHESPTTLERSRSGDSPEQDSESGSDSSVDSSTRRPSTSTLPHSRDSTHDGVQIVRTQSAKESTRPKEWRSEPHDQAVRGQDHDNKTMYGRSKSAPSEAQSTGAMAPPTRLQTGRSTLFKWLSDMKARMATLESRVERALTSPISRSSSIPRGPIASYASAGFELPREISEKSSIGIAEGPDGGDRATGEEGLTADGDDDGDLQSPVEQVALIVPTTDDPSVPYWTFRTVVLGILSCGLITFLNTYFSYRNEPIVISVTTVLIATAPIGKFMAKTLPDRFIRIPGMGRGFSLNPGPFSMKEHGLITIFASAGSVRPGGIYVYNIAKVFLHGHIGFLPGFIVTLTTELFGYSWAVLLYKFFVEPARFWWPGSLVNVSLSQALNMDEKRKGISLMAFFIICFAVTCAYYVIPGFFIPSLTSVSVICYIFKHNVLAQQLGSGSNGLGLGSFSLDWATISSFSGSPLIVPWAAVANMALGFILQAYLVAPLTYWKNWFHSKHYPIFSRDIFTRSGQPYDLTKVLERTHSKFHRNKAGLSEEGLPYFSAFYTMSVGFTFALFGAVCSQVLFFNGKDLLQTYRRVVTGRSADAPDVHTRLMSKYPQISLRWCLLLFIGTHLAAIVNVVVYKDQLEIKWWGVLLGTAVTGVMVVPICILVATSSQTPNLGIIPQYLMGFIREGEPITNVMFRTYSTVICGRTATYLGNFKLGHYMKIPPRATFYGQLMGTFISSLVSMIVASMLTESIDDICDNTRLPANSPWTCPHDRVFYDQAVMFGIAGTNRLFAKEGAPYKTLNYYFIPGFLLPVALWLLGLALPRREWIHLINGPLIVKGVTLMPPSPVVNNAMWIYVALFFSIYVFHYKKQWWQRYNYVLSAALDAGTVVMALMLYYSLHSGKKVLHWWGERAHGDHCSVAMCPTAPGIHRPGCPVF
ncbi:unnamed protein product [Calypogeia fissa]